MSDAIPLGELHHACCLMCVCQDMGYKNRSDAIPVGELHHACCLKLLWQDTGEE